MQEEEKVAGFAERIATKWQFLLDKSSPLITARWFGFVVSLYIYILRVYLVNGWYIVTYGLGIFLLSQSIGFLSPQVNRQLWIFSCHEFIHGGDYDFSQCSTQHSYHEIDPLTPCTRKLIINTLSLVVNDLLFSQS